MSMEDIDRTIAQAKLMEKAKWNLYVKTDNGLVEVIPKRPSDIEGTYVRVEEALQTLSDLSQEMEKQ